MASKFAIDSSVESITISSSLEKTNNVVYSNIKGISGIILGSLKSCYIGVPENHPWDKKTCEFFNSPESPISVNGGITYTDIDSILNGVLNQPLAISSFMLLSFNKYKYWIGWDYNDNVDNNQYTSAFEVIRHEVIQTCKVGDELIRNCRIA